MNTLICPNCHKKAMTLLDKIKLTPPASVKCRSCNQSLSISNFKLLIADLSPILIIVLLFNYNQFPILLITVLVVIYLFMLIISELFWLDLIKVEEKENHIEETYDLNEFLKNINKK